MTRGKGCTLKCIGGGSIVFLQCFINNLLTVKLSRSVSRRNYNKLFKVVRHFCTQNNVICGRKLLLALKGKLNELQ